MSSNNPSFKVGVLNMTISFQQPKQRLKVKRETQPRHVKMHAVPAFIPRYSLPRSNNNVSIQKNQEQLSPYQRYHQTHKESIRYFRQHYQSTRKQRNIQGLSPKNNKTIQLQFNDSLVQQQKVICAPKESNDGHLKLVFNKRHLRNTVDLQNQSKTESFAMYFNRNPEQNLKNIFTVRTINTSMRSRRKINTKEDEKVIFRALKTKQQGRYNQKKLEDSTLIQKKIRPWSPNKNYFDKEVMFQSEILATSQPQQSRLQ